MAIRVPTSEIHFSGSSTCYNRLVEMGTDTTTTPATSRWKTDFVYDGMGRLRIRREYTWSSSGGGGGGGETEVSKSLMTLSGSEQCYGWNFALAANGLTTDPGWANCTYTRPIEYLRVDLGAEHNVSHVAYEPRVMGPSESDGTWNGVYKQYAIYVTDSSSGNQADWGAPVATGTWTWPNRQERKDVTFTPKTGRYVYFARITAYGWYSEQGYPGYAGANEIWVYEQTGGGGSGDWTLAGETRYLYDGKLVVQERDSSNTPLVTYTRGKDLSGSLDGAGGIAGLLARTSGSSGGGGESEVSKGGMTLSGSGTCSGWVYAYAKDGLTADPGWVNCSYTSANEFLRVDLGSSHNVSHVAYEPRVMQNDGGAGGTWNGVYKNYAIYVTDDASDNPSNWGAPVATGTWTWPNLQERKDVTFTPKAGRYVYFFRVSGYGWWTELGNPGYAGANEIWVYEQSGGGGGTLVHSYYHADGNGNVTCMLDNNQSIVASYKYDPYGRTLSSSGSLAAANVYRFSSKEMHANSGMYYYLYRFYDPNTQRWPNRDPIGEQGGLNLFADVGNDPANWVDPYGLFGDGRHYGPESNRQSLWLGHSDFYGHQWFDFTWEDHDPHTSPMDPINGNPANHFQDLRTSLAQARAAIEHCDRDAFQRAMHRVQDFYSHYNKGYRWDPEHGQYGHWYVAAWPDHDNEAWEHANRVTRTLVDEWTHKNGRPPILQHPGRGF